MLPLFFFHWSHQFVSFTTNSLKSLSHLNGLPSLVHMWEASTLHLLVTSFLRAPPPSRPRT